VKGEKKKKSIPSLHNRWGVLLKGEKKKKKAQIRAKVRLVVRVSHEEGRRSGAVVALVGSREGGPPSIFRPEISRGEKEEKLVRSGFRSTSFRSEKKKEASLTGMSPCLLTLARRRSLPTGEGKLPSSF